MQSQACDLVKALLCGIAAAQIRVKLLQRPDREILCTPHEALELARCGSGWKWRLNKSGKVNRMTELDSRRPNSWQPCWRNTEASINGLSDVAHRPADWGDYRAQPLGEPRRMPRGRTGRVEIPRAPRVAQRKTKPTFAAGVVYSYDGRDDRG